MARLQAVNAVLDGLCKAPRSPAGLSCVEKNAVSIVLGEYNDIMSGLTVSKSDTKQHHHEQLACHSLLEAAGTKLLQLRAWVESWETKTSNDHLAQMRSIFPCGTFVALS